MVPSGVAVGDVRALVANKPMAGNHSAKITAENVFVVETPLQLLNAVEAKKHFGLANNHLILHLGTAFAPARLHSLIAEQDWDGIHNIEFHKRTMDVASPLLGASIAKRLSGYGYDYQQFLNKRKADALAATFSRARNIFLGNYLRGAQVYMRHLANSIPHEHLYLLDDGTDALIVNDERRLAADKGCATRVVSRLKSTLRQSLIEWNDKEADSLTFFSAYRIEVSQKDRLIKNEYTYLRNAAARSSSADEVLFLGQTLVEDRYVTVDYYMNYLKKIKRHYASARVVYVPHPRQSSAMADAIGNSLGFEIRPLNVPVEYEVSIGGNVPAVLASFFSSALQSCQTILNEKSKFDAFYIAPMHLMRSRKPVEYVYEYFRTKTDANFAVVEL